MHKLVFATNNNHKLIEVRSIAGDNFQILSLKDIDCFDEIPEDNPTIAENALQKARYIKNKYGYDCFADDTGLMVKSLNGAPGVYSARYAGNDCNSDNNISKLLFELKNKNDRTAKFITVVALLINGNEYLFEGSINGIITHEKHGLSGFGYDPIFKPDGYNLTFAELGSDIKNKISHRALAIKKLSEFLNR